MKIIITILSILYCQFSFGYNSINFISPPKHDNQFWEEFIEFSYNRTIHMKKYSVKCISIFFLQEDDKCSVIFYSGDYITEDFDGILVKGSVIFSFYNLDSDCNFWITKSKFNLKWNYFNKNYNLNNETRHISEPYGKIFLINSPSNIKLLYEGMI